MAGTSVQKYGIFMESEENNIVSDRNEEIHLVDPALFESAANGNYYQVLNILNSGVSINAEKLSSLLQIAAANNHDKCLQILIDHGANVNGKGFSGATALHMAAKYGNYLCVKALLDANADPSPSTKFYKLDNDLTIHDVGGITPLHLAAANNHVDCVKELIQHGANFNAVDVNGHTSLYIALKNGFYECAMAHFENFNGRDIFLMPSFDTSNTLLHLAVSHGMIDCVKALLKLGSDVNHINYAGRSPLHLALSLSNNIISDQDYLELVKLLILEGYNTDINYPDVSGFTPLHYVCFGRLKVLSLRPELAKFLISQGANVNIENSIGFTLLEYELGTSGENSDTLKYIIKSMLHLPRLKSLYLNQCELLRKHARALSNMEMSEYERALHRICFKNTLDENIHMPIIPPRNENENIISPNMHSVLPMDVLNAIPLSDRFGLFSRGRRYAQQQPPTTDNMANRNSSVPLERQLWYDELASNPRTLQHNCRYVIRSYMGSVKQKNIERLPIPDAMKSYLLLEGNL